MSKKTKTRTKKQQEKDEVLSASKALRKARSEHHLRKDVKESMRRICPDGYDYTEAIAEAEHSSDVGYYIQESKKYTITPEDAEELYLFHNYESQRRFNQAYSTQLSEEMKVAIDISIAVGPDGYPVIVNGQHTLWAIHMRGMPTAASVTIYQCRNKEAIAKLFTIFDSNLKRSVTMGIEAAKTAGSLITPLAGSRLRSYSQAAAAAENDFKQPKRVPLSAQVERARRQIVQDFAHWMEDMIEDAVERRISNLQGILAAFYAMFISDKAKATEFVKPYLKGTDLRQNSPILTLRNKIIGRPPGEHAGFACRQHAEFVWAAWQKFCTNQPLKIMRRCTVLPPPDKWKINAPPVKKSAVGDKKELGISGI